MTQLDLFNVATKQLELFDAKLGMELRDIAVQRVGEAHADWVQAAVRTLYGVCKNHREFTTDDLWQRISSPVERRAMGAVITAARKKGWIETTDRFRESTRPVCHRNPKRIWRSLL